MSEADDVLRSVDQLRRDLSGYHGQLKAHNDLQRHCENQRKRIGELEGLYAKAKAENAKLRELAAGIGHLLFSLDVDYCAICPRDDINHPCPVYTVGGGECLYKTDLHELGVEVDDD